MLARLPKPSQADDPGVQVMLNSWLSAWITAIISSAAAVLTALALLLIPDFQYFGAVYSSSRGYIWAGIAILAVATTCFAAFGGAGRWPIRTWCVPSQYAAAMTAALLFMLIPIAAMVSLFAFPPLVFGLIALRRITNAPARIAMLTSSGLFALLASMASEIPPLAGKPGQPYYLAHASIQSKALMVGAWVGFTLYNFYWHWYWQHVTESLIDVAYEQTQVEPARIRAAFDALIHNGVVSTLERVAAGHPTSADDRAQAGELASQIREGLLADPYPRSIQQLLRGAVKQAADVHVVLHLLPYVVGEPPRSVVRAVGEALAYMVSNLQHAMVGEAQLAVNATTTELDLTLHDTGMGFGVAGWQEASPSGRRISQCLAQVGATGNVRSSIGHGTTYEIRWRERS